MVAARIGLDPRRLGAVDHGCVGDVDVGDRVVVGFTERADGQTVGACAGDSCDGDVVAAGFEGDAVIVVDHGNVGHSGVG